MEYAVSMHPPTYADGGEQPTPDWALLDFRAYVPETPRRNATTASCPTSHGWDIEVTFFPARPPRLSYFCVHCPGAKPSIFPTEPQVIATDGGFALLWVAIGHREELSYSSAYDFYVYRARGAGGGPALELLPQPQLYSFHDKQVGLLSRGREYTVAALRDDSSTFFRDVDEHRPGQYDVCLLHSEDKVWTAMDVSVPPQLVEQHGDFEEGFRHVTAKVITIGGEYGTMAFADLWRGILLYDVHRGDPMLRYITTPHQLPDGKRPNSGAWVARDIALVQGRIKFVETLMRGTSCCFSDGWVVCTWSRMATFPEGDSWCPSGVLQAPDITGENSPLHKDMRRRLLDDNGEPRLGLDRFNIGHPTLSLDDDDVVYFMVRLGKAKRWVVSIDMRLKTLERVAELGVGRTFGIGFTFIPTRISKYLNMARGTKADLKRAGTLLSGSCSKRFIESSNVGTGSM
ncbi:hypothetical protein ACP4OV_031444 [Aristida adscensionis]